MKRIFALLLAFWVLCLSVCADEVLSDSSSVEDSSPSVEDPAPAIEDLSPAVDDPAPAIEDPAPAIEDPAPASDDLVSDEVNNDTTIETPAPFPDTFYPVADISSPSYSLDEILSAVYESAGSSAVVTQNDYTLTDVSTMALPPITPSSTSGLKAALLTVLGNYDPVVVVYQYQSSSSGYYNYATDVQPDYAWIASAAVLALVIWCLFKLGGALLRG